MRGPHRTAPGAGRPCPGPPSSLHPPGGSRTRGPGAEPRCGRSGSASDPPAARAVPTLLHLLLSSTKRFYSRLRAISVHISPEIYSQANIRDPSGGFKRQVLLLLKEGVMDSLRRPASLLPGGRAVAAGTGLRPGGRPRDVSVRAPGRQEAATRAARSSGSPAVVVGGRVRRGLRVPAAWLGEHRPRTPAEGPGCDGFPAQKRKWVPGPGPRRVWVEALEHWGEGGEPGGAEGSPWVRRP